MAQMNTDTESTQRREVAKAQSVQSPSAVTKLMVQSFLNLFPEVAWDRWTGTGDRLTVFGWIDRRDSYKDFMVVIFEDEVIRFITSSALHSASFSKRIGGENHVDCRRVEGVFSVRTVPNPRSSVSSAVKPNLP